MTVNVKFQYINVTAIQTSSKRYSKQSHLGIDISNYRKPDVERFYVLFNSISVISGGREGTERWCAKKQYLHVKRFPPGIKPRAASQHFTN